MEVNLPSYYCEYTWQLAAKVVGRVTDESGHCIGKASNNPVLNLRLYEVVFHHGHVEKLLITFNLDTALLQLLKFILIGN
jgi:hypothetical protein